MEKRFENVEDNLAFERWLDLTSKLILKYGDSALKKIDNKQMRLFDINYKYDRSYIRGYWRKSRYISKIHVA